jgi:hypothetical protein
MRDGDREAEASGQGRAAAASGAQAKRQTAGAPREARGSPGSLTDTLFVEAPDYAEPLDGWRVWRVVAREGGLLLGSVVKRTQWPIGEPLVADCLRRRSPLRRRRSAHDAPDFECECGIYATTLELVGRYLLDSFPIDAVALVLGRVALWGTVVECERGHRASHAYPLELYVPSDAAKRGKLAPIELADRLSPYSVPVEVLSAPGDEALRILSASRC